MKKQELKVQENKARRQLRKQGRLLHKPRTEEGYMIIDALDKTVVFGGDALLSLDDVFQTIGATEDYLDCYQEEREVLQFMNQRTVFNLHHGSTGSAV